MGKVVWTGKVNYDPTVLRDRPKTWGRKPSLVFFTSLSDPFHAELSDDQIQEMLDGCAAYPQHIWQWLTKRPERAAALADKLRWPENIWIGATIEADSEVWRADELRKIPVATKFISAEPLTTDALPSLDLTDISWLIVGGESGPGAEPMSIEWARSLRDRAVKSGVAFFFKQWGKFGPDGLRHKRSEGQNDVLLDGRVWQEFPRVALDHGQHYARLRGELPPEEGEGAEPEGPPRWEDVDHFRIDLAFEHRYERQPPRIDGETPRIALREPIWRTLRDRGPMTSPHLRDTVLPSQGMSSGSARHVNFHAWALVDLLHMGWVESFSDIVAGKRGRTRRVIKYRATKPRIRVPAR